MKTLIPVIITILILTSCGDGDGDSSPNDISGYWEGNGVSIANYFSHPVYAQIWLQPAGYGYYDVYVELYAEGYVFPAYGVWFYQNGQINSQDGRVGSVNGNTMEIDSYESGMHIKLTLYRY